MNAAARYFIGIMTGTSLDGIDVALVDFSGTQPRLVAALGAPLDAELRAELLALQTAGPDELHRAALAANAHSRACASAVLQLLQQAGVPAERITAIGNHGQTIRHRPELGYTLQIGNHALLAELTGICVVGDFRSRDVAAGGQGAPLVPAFHHALFADASETRVIVNVGGIANLTVLPTRGDVVPIPDRSEMRKKRADDQRKSQWDSANSTASADDEISVLSGIGTTGWDSGPGNVLMDLWIQRHLGQAYDANGAWAASGKILPDLFERLLAEQWFALPAPKSTGRDLFHADWLAAHLSDRQDAPQDVQATLCALTARTIADAARNARPATLYLCGGGAHNGELRRMLAAELPQTRITTTAELGVDPDWVEAYAFAWLARSCVDRTPANLPAVTGARGLRILGAVYPQ